VRRGGEPPRRGRVETPRSDDRGSRADGVPGDGQVAGGVQFGGEFVGVLLADRVFGTCHVSLWRTCPSTIFSSFRRSQERLRASCCYLLSVLVPARHA
jgi:hypothetical protein